MLHHEVFQAVGSGSAAWLQLGMAAGIVMLHARTVARSIHGWFIKLRGGE